MELEAFISWARGWVCGNTGADAIDVIPWEVGHLGKDILHEVELALAEDMDALTEDALGWLARLAEEYPHRHPVASFRGLGVYILSPSYTSAGLLLLLRREKRMVTTLKRTRQFEDDALQAHLRLLSLTSRTGVVEEAWAKANGVRARAEEDHWMWVTRHERLLRRLEFARQTFVVVQKGGRLRAVYDVPVVPGTKMYSTHEGHMVPEGHPDALVEVGVALYHHPARQGIPATLEVQLI